MQMRCIEFRSDLTALRLALVTTVNKIDNGDYQHTHAIGVTGLKNVSLYKRQNITPKC